MKKSDKLLARGLVIGLLLLLSHMLQITPKEFDAIGAKIEIKDPIVIQGALAILYLHNFWEASAVSFVGKGFLSIKLDVLTNRALLAEAYRPFKDHKTKRTRRRTPQEAKKIVWRKRLRYNLLMIPYAMIMLCGILFALLIALIDAIRFVMYIWHQPWDFGLEKIISGIGSLLA